VKGDEDSKLTRKLDNNLLGIYKMRGETDGEKKSGYC